MSKQRRLAPNMAMNAMPPKKSPEETAERLAALEVEQRQIEEQSMIVGEDEGGAETPFPTPLKVVPDIRLEVEEPRSRQRDQAEISVEKGRLYRDIPVSLIDPNPYAPREVYTPEMIKARSDALRTQGQHDPVHVIPNPDAPGRFIIADGWTRVLACIEYKVMDRLLAHIHSDLSIEQAAWFGYQQNEEREQHTDYDRAMFYSKMIDEKGMTAREVASRVGISESRISQYRAYTKLPAQLLDVVKGSLERFTCRPVYEIQRLNAELGETRALEVALDFASSNETHSELMKRVQALIAPIKKKRATSASTPDHRERYRNGHYRVEGQRFELVITVDQEKREQFRAQLEALLQTVADANDSKDSDEHQEASKPS